MSKDKYPSTRFCPSCGADNRNTMTVEEAIQILDPETSREYIKNNEIYLQEVNEACEIACNIMRQWLLMEDDLK